MRETTPTAMPPCFDSGFHLDGTNHSDVCLSGYSSEYATHVKTAMRNGVVVLTIASKPKLKKQGLDII